MKINWKVRMKNPQWWGQMILAVAAPVAAYFGLTGADMDSWSVLWGTMARAFGNPYVVALMLVSAYNAVTDPTTPGVRDSDRAMTYTAPGEAEK